jgi:hypothetical protein
MNPQLKQLLRMAIMGAAGGFVFIFVIFVLGLNQPSPDGEKGSVRILTEWLNTPLVWLMDWVTKRNFIAVDNISVGLIAIFTYWIFLGAIVAISGYYLRQLIFGCGCRVWSKNSSDEK